MNVWIFPKLLIERSGKTLKDCYKGNEKIYVKFYVKTNGSTLK